MRAGLEMDEQMSNFDKHLLALDDAVKDVVKWPYKRERNEALTHLAVYLANILGLEVRKRQDQIATNSQDRDGNGGQKN